MSRDFLVTRDFFGGLAAAAELSRSKAAAEVLRGNRESVGPGVWLNRKLDEIALAFLFLVGDVGHHRIVSISRAQVSMKLIDGFNAGKLA